jgi:hypothetical protein
MATRPPLTGYNHNVRYGGRVFHVQTEDSGEDSPHIYTHLFLAGGIIASARTDYQELVGTPGADEKVRKMMQEQHKRLMKQLRRGEYDEKIISMVGSLEPVEAEGAPAVEVAALPMTEGVIPPEIVPSEVPAGLAPTPAASALVSVATEPEGVQIAVDQIAVEQEPAAAAAVRAEPLGIEEVEEGELEIAAVTAAQLSQQSEYAAGVDLPPLTGPAEVESMAVAAARLSTMAERVDAAIDLPDVEQGEVEIPAVAAAQLSATIPAVTSIDLPEDVGPAEVELTATAAQMVDTAVTDNDTAEIVSPPVEQDTGELPPVVVVAPLPSDEVTMRTPIPAAAAHHAQRRPTSREAPPVVARSEVKTMPPLPAVSEHPTHPMVSRQSDELRHTPRTTTSPSRLAVPGTKRASEELQAVKPMEIHVEVTERVEQPRPVRPPTGRVATPPPIPRDAPYEAESPAATMRPRTALPRLPRSDLVAFGKQQSDEPSVIVDRPPSGDAVSGYSERPSLLSPTFYSQVRKREEETPASAGQVRSRGVFSTPLPGTYTARPDESPLPGPLQSRRSGVYAVPGMPPHRPPHPDPAVRSRPAYGSTPQRYTAPSRSSASPVPVPKRKGHSTGSYERAPWARPPGGPATATSAGVASPPAATVARAKPPSQPRVSRSTPRPPSAEVRPRPGSVEVRTTAPVAETRVPARSPRPASAEVRPRPVAPSTATPAPRSRPVMPVARPASQPQHTPAPRPAPPPVARAATDVPSVVARPAVMIGQPEGQTRRPPPAARVVRAGPPVAPKPTRSPTPPTAPRAVERPQSIFGSDLITERSLDEVILSYLAEDIESSDD